MKAEHDSSPGAERLARRDEAAARTTIEIERSDGIAVVALARPPANTVDLVPVSELGEALGGLATQPGVVAVVLTDRGSERIRRIVETEDEPLLRRWM